MGDEALSYLRRRADVSDAAAEPQPYQVLYWIPLCTCWQQRPPFFTLPPKYALCIATQTANLAAMGR